MNPYPLVGLNHFTVPLATVAPPMLHPNNTKPAPKYVKRSQERHNSGFVPKLARPAISRRAGQASGPGPIGSSQPTKGRGHTVRDSTRSLVIPIKTPALSNREF